MNYLKPSFAVLLAIFLSACSEKPPQSHDQSTSSSDLIEPRVLKLAETWPPNFPIFGEATKNLAKHVEAMSGGRLLIQIDSRNKHKAPFGIFDLVSAGQYDMGHSASYYWKGKVPNTLFFTSMPFGMTAPEQYAWFYFDDGMTLMQELYAQHNLLSFPGGNTANQMGGWFQKEINTVADFQGLKMRIPGFAGEVLAKIGAKPTNIAPGELYTALERNTIDALEWVGPSLDLRMGFHKIAPYYYTGWHEPASELQFLINKSVYESLPKDLQAILTSAMRVSAYDMYIQSYHESAINWETMKKEYPNIQIKTFPPSVIQALKQANDELLSEFSSKDEFAKRVIESQSNYLNKARAWTNISDHAYIKSLNN